MAIPVEVTSPVDGSVVDADTELVFVVEFDGLPDALTADVTLGDGTVERAWEYDQAVNGYTGSLEVDGTTRTYSLRRPIGWPFGAMSVAVHVEASGGAGETLLYDSGVLPTARHVHGDTSILPPWELANVINSAWTGTLRMRVNADVKWVSAPASNVMGAYQGDPGQTNPFSEDSGSGGATLTTLIGSSTYVNKDLDDNGALTYYDDFTAPGVTKSVYLYPPVTFAGGFTPTDAWFQNLHVTIHEVGGDDEGDATASWTVDAPDAVSRTIIQYREAPRLNNEIRFWQLICQQIAAAALSIPPLDDPAEAGGVNLDVTADLVGQRRMRADGAVPTDAQLRVLIAARISRNNARVSTADYLRALIALFGATVRISTDAGMSIAYVVMREPTADEIAVLDEDIVARPMGVKVLRSWAPENYFGYVGDPEALGYGVGHYVEGF